MAHLKNDGYSLDMKMIDYIRSSFKDILDIEKKTLKWDEITKDM